MGRRNPYPFHSFLLLFLFGLSVIGGCHSPQSDSETKSGRPLTIIVGETVLYKRPDRLSPKVNTLTYGQQLKALPKKPFSATFDWTEVRIDKDHSGFVQNAALGTPEMMENMQRVIQSIQGIEPQATGVTTAPTYLRLEPGRQGKPVEKLRKGTRFEMFERQATLHSKPNDALNDRPPRKDIWYKVRLTDGRVGYIYTGNFKLEPPSEISEYTRFRRTLAWLKLRTVKGEDFESANEYLVAYATSGVDLGADFDRIEVYFWDGDSYQTAFVASSLRGILPIRVIRQEKDIYFEFSELDPDHEKQVLVYRYHYAYPYKKVGSTSLQLDVGLH